MPIRARRLAGLILALACGGADAAPTERPDEALRAALIQAIGEADSFQHRFDAEVWLVDMASRVARYLPHERERLEFLRMVHGEATRAQLSPELVLAVIDVESKFDRYAISSAGALGLMQIMPFWLDEIGKPEDNLFNMRTNLRFGCTILKHYLTREKGNVVNALARYNGSYGKPQYPTLVLTALNKRWYRS
jgi:soluble lytic murein transglycosylase-like protein